MANSTELVSHDGYYESKKHNEPRQKLFAVMRYEKANQTDQPGWIFKTITQDQSELLKTLKTSIELPNTDNQGWVSNKEDVILVELIPTDIYVKKI
ncbi:hypothetical protein ACFHWD_04175 [Clostridium sp. MT-14]|uniref:hypothetical protein n=1 Tax=Clostridium sp. MT-14 TaxID=3348360 RepID=UPI0035F4B101